MSPSSASAFAPPWFKCFACLLAMLPFPGMLLALVKAPASYQLLAATYISYHVFLAGMHCLVAGYPQPAFFTIAANLATGWFKATHDSRLSDHQNGTPT